jgi:hypothetical protein
MRFYLASGTTKTGFVLKKELFLSVLFIVVGLTRQRIKSEIIASFDFYRNCGIPTGRCRENQ